MPMQSIFDDPDVPVTKCFQMISACNAQNVFTIKEYLNSCGIVFYDCPQPVAWTEVIKVSPCLHPMHAYVATI